MSSDSRGASDIAERYASALFDLSVADGRVDQVAADLAQLGMMISGSAELRHLMLSPVFSSADRLKAITSLSERASFCQVVKIFLE